MINLTEHRAGEFKNKMDGFTSINVSVKCNDFCQQMQKQDGLICKHCYAKRVFPNMEKRYSDNIDWFLSDDFRPEPINRNIVRIHSFGELYNEKHFENLIKLFNYNPNTLFTMWTKRKDIVKRVFAMVKKPSNLILQIAKHRSAAPAARAPRLPSPPHHLSYRSRPNRPQPPASMRAA